MIVNGWSDMNRGDSAILLGMISLIRRHFPNSSICIMSEFDDSDPNFASSYWVIKLLYPDVKILPALFPYPKGGRKIVKAINAASMFAISYAVAAFPPIGRYLFRGQKSNTWREVMESDVLLSKGGHIFYLSRCSPQALFGFFKHAFPLLLGTRIGKKTVLFGQSIGPFRSKIGQLVAKWFFDRLDAISVRESISLNTVQNLGVRRPVYLVPDAAFILYEHSLEEKRLIFDEHLVIVTPRQWGFEDRKVLDNYIKSLSFIVDWLAAEGYNVLLVSHTIGPTSSEDDRVAVQHLYKFIESKERVKIFDTDGLTPYDLISLYASARLLIGTRFHSVIFAMLTGTPVIAISYFGPKTLGIMKELGLEQFVFNIGDLNVVKLKSVIRYILKNQDQIRKEIRERIKKLKLREEAERSGVALLNSVLKEG